MSVYIDKYILGLKKKGYFLVPLTPDSSLAWLWPNRTAVCTVSRQQRSNQKRLRSEDEKCSQTERADWPADLELPSDFYFCWEWFSKVWLFKCDFWVETKSLAWSWFLRNQKQSLFQREMLSRGMIHSRLSCKYSLCGVHIEQLSHFILHSMRERIRCNVTV